VLQKSKVDGTLTQLRTADLAFTEEETIRWCRDLSPEQALAVYHRTEGWPAMVRLMAIAIGTDDLSADQASQDLGLADYLFGETFRQQPRTTQEVMLLTSVPETVPLDLATMVTGYADAGEVLELATHRSGLVTRRVHPDTGTPEYRLHPMLRAYLHGELQRRDQEAERAAQRTTARWCLTTGLPLEAVRHATASADPAFQEWVVRAAGPGLINAGDAALLLSALDSPGRRRGEESVWTHLIRAAAMLDTGRLYEAGVELRLVGPVEEYDAGEDTDLAVALQATDAHLQRRRGTLVDVSPTTPGLASEDPDLRLMLAAQRGSALAWQGDDDAAEAELREGIDLARGTHRMAALVDCLAFSGGVHAARSAFEPMRVAAQEALDVGEAHGWGDTPRMAYPHALRAWAAYQALDDDVARAHVARAVELVEPTADPTVLLSVQALHAGLAYDASGSHGSGSPADDASALHHVVASIPGHEVPPFLVVTVALADAWISLELQRHGQVPEIVDLLETRLGAIGEVDLIRAGIHHATGRNAEARALLVSLTERPEDFVVPLSVVETATFAAALAHADGDLYNATALARIALDASERLQGFRPLVAADPAFHDLLRSSIGRWGLHEPLVARVLDRASTPNAAPAVALTARELEVLRELPNLNTVDEIADVLFVSVNTVKTHLRSLYRKLQVGSRRAAVAEARRLGLL
jgi:LuxR family maltose regulon positive regulatory protein